MNPARHPFIFGTFTRIGDEIKAARGKASSQDFEKWANEADHDSAAARSAASDFDQFLEEVKREAARFIDEQPEQREQIEAIAADLKQRFERAKEQRLSTARQHQERADEHRRNAEQARAFEARFDFVPYVDRFLDSVDQLQREQEAKASKRTRGQSKAKTRP